MKIKQKTSLLIAGFAFVAALGMVPATTVTAKKCGGVDTAIISCPQQNKGKNVENNAVWGILELVLNILTAGVGIVAVATLVVASIMYASAGDKAAQVQLAVTMITNVVIGIVAFGLMYAFLQFLIPGGVFS